jgi:tripartite ATP-independent transporter DctP family solute receptor
MSLFRVFAVIVLIGAVTLTVFAFSHERERHIKVGTVLNRTHPTAASLAFFADRLEALSDGQLKVDVFFSSQLGSANEVLELCRMGDVEMAQVSTASLTVYAPLANALQMPFIWRNPQHQRKALEGEVGSFIKQEAEQVGLQIMGFFDAGTRNITTNEGPIEKPEDLQGKKIRVMSSPLMVAAINDLGASATALNMGEVYTALQMGVIDGWENNPMTIVDYRMYETGCKYFAWTRHFSIPDLFVAGQPFLDRLTDQEKQWVDQAVSETVEKQHQLWKESEEKALAEMREQGMLINEVQGNAFRERVKPTYEEYYAKYGDEFRALCEMIEGVK